MKLKTLLVAISTALISAQAAAQDVVRYAPVVTVEPIRHVQSFPQTVQTCTPFTVPIYRNVYRPTGDSVQAVTTLLGAVIGGASVRSEHRAVGALAGAAVGAVVGAPHPYHGVPEIVGYEQRHTCTVQHTTYEQQVIIGYNVTYSDNGVLKTITMSNHPGTQVRIITTTRIQ